MLLVLAAAGATLGAPAGETAADGSPIGQAFKGIPVKSVEVHGLDSKLASMLVKGLELAGRSRWLGRERARFYPETLEEDLARSLLFLARHGHPYPAVDVRLESDRRRRFVTVHLDVVPGPRVFVDTLLVSGLPEGFRVSRLPLRRGEAFRDAAVEDALERIVSELQEAGHSRARARAVVTKLDSSRVKLEIVSKPGPIHTIAEVSMEGVPDDLAGVARTRVGVHPGDRFAPTPIVRSEADIRKLNLFRQVRAEVDSLGPDALSLRFVLSERQHRTIQAGFGFYSDEFIRGNLLLEHRNLLGHGRGGRFSADASRYLQRAGVELWTPALLGSRTRGSTSLDLRREDEEAYLLQSVRGELWTRRDLWRELESHLGVRVSYIDVRTRTTAPTLEQPEGLVTSIIGYWKWDRSDDRIDPTRGSITQTTLEYTPPRLRSVTRYFRASWQATVYRQVLPSTILASRVLAGVGRPLGESATLLASKRFFAGGSRSVRGFKRRALGPRDDAGNPLGGEVVLEGSTELRFPLWGPLLGGGFLDAGQVWERRTLLQLDELKFSAGPALMFRTPIGPVRLDWGFRLGPKDDRPSQVLHFIVGHPF